MKEDNGFFSALTESFEKPADDEEIRIPDILEYVAALLEEIEENTRTVRFRESVPARAQANSGASSGLVNAGKSVKADGATRSGGTARSSAESETPPRKTALQSSSKQPPAPSPVQTAVKPSAENSVQAQATKIPNVSESSQPARPVVMAPGNAFPPVSTEADPQIENRNGGTQSEEAMQRRREADAVQAESRGLADALKQNLGGWNGTFSSAEKGDMDDTAGLAAGGPLWGAIMEVKDAVNVGSDDDASLLGVLKKTVADKTGVTAAKQKVENAQTAAKDAILKWAGVEQVVPTTEPKQEKRDNKGRTLSRSKPSGVEKQQLELAQNTLALATTEAKEEDKRHEELKKIIAQSGSGGSGGGLFDDLPEFDRDRKSGRNKGSKGGKGKPGVLRRTGSRLSRAGKSAGGMLMRGGKTVASGVAAAGGLLGVSGMLGGAAGATGTAGIAAGTAGVAGAAGTAGITGRVAATASRPVGLLGSAGKALSKAGSLGAKGLSGAIRAVPIIGQIAATGMAVMDGVQGWNDTDMQREAFDLQEGQEASTGQKASASAANILDMGGLLTGAAGLMGFEVDTADLTRGIYDAGSALGDAAESVTGSIASFFGFGDEEPAKASVENKPAAPPEVKPPVPTEASLPASTISAIASVPATAPVSAPLKSNALEIPALGVPSVGVLPPASVTAAASVRSIASTDEEKGLLVDLTAALLGLKAAIAEEIDAVAEESGGILSEVGSFFSGGGSGGGYAPALGGIAGNSGTVSSGYGGGSSASASSATQAAIPLNAELGSVISKYESGKEGSAAIGYDSHGGTSYGKYQLSSKAGSMAGFLKDMEAKGGESAAIAQRLRAAGPMNTGSRSGAMASQWKKEVAANPELFEKAEREYMIKDNYAPAMARLNPELRKRVESSKTLQEAMFSTAVQHGGYGEKKGAGAIWNKVYREGMSDEDLLSSVYQERSTRFGSSSAAVQASGRSRMQRENAELQRMLVAEKQQKTGSASDAVAATVPGAAPDATPTPASGTVSIPAPVPGSASAASPPSVPSSVPVPITSPAPGSAPTFGTVTTPNSVLVPDSPKVEALRAIGTQVLPQARSMVEKVTANMGGSMYGIDLTKLADMGSIPAFATANAAEPQAGQAAPVPGGSALATPAQTALQTASLAEVPQNQPSPVTREPEVITPSPAFEPQQSQQDSGKIEQLLAELIMVVRQQGIGDKSRSASGNDLHIPMDFEDSYLTGIAHDRA